MQRITVKNLETLRDTLNRTAGLPLVPYQLNDDGTLKRDADRRTLPNEGTYVLDWAYGGVQLNRIDGGGESHVINGFGTKRELYEKMHAYLDGFIKGRDQDVGLANPYSY